MFALFHSFILLLAAAGGHDDGFFNKYLNYPGFEAWKFFNLAIFVAILIYLLKKPLSAAFKAKRETIRAELIKAEEEKRAALEKLTAAEARLAQLEAERAAILSQAEKEAAAEKTRLAEQTEFEIQRLRQQTESEIQRLSQLLKLDLRKFSAQESIRIAEEKIRVQMDADKDARLVKANIQSIGGLN